MTPRILPVLLLSLAACTTSGGLAPGNGAPDSASPDTSATTADVNPAADVVVHE